MIHRDGRLFVRCLIYVLITGCVFLAICAGAVKLLSDHEDGGGSALTLVLVNEDESYFGDFVLNIISSNENIVSAVEVVSAVSEAEAIDAVKHGAAGALILPDDFFASVDSGENYPCRIILNDDNMAAASMIRRFSDLGSDMLSSAQYAVYEGDLYLREQGADESVRSEYNLILNGSMAAEIADAPDRYFRIKDLGYTNRGLSVFGHYAAVYLAFFFGILSMAFFHLYRDDCERGTLIRLRSAGVGKRRFLFWKVLLCGFAYAAVLAVVCIVFRSRITPGPAAVLLSVCAVLFAAYFCACIGIAFGNSSAAVLFVIFFVSLFFCGGIIPYSGLSQTALAIGNATPIGVIYALLSPLFGGSISISVILPAMIYLAVGTLFYSVCIDRTVLGRETV